MQFVFDERKATEAAAELLRLNGGRMSYLRLVKLMYLADRKCLVETGLPITGDLMYSLRRGPILSEVLDLAESRTPVDSVWGRVVAPVGPYHLKLLPHSPGGSLSRYQREVLKAVWNECKDMKTPVLLRHLHDVLPEWDNPGGSRKAILPEEILRDENWQASDIEDLASDVAAASSMKRLLATAPA